MTSFMNATTAVQPGQGGTATTGEAGVSLREMLEEREVQIKDDEQLAIIIIRIMEPSSD